MSVVHGAALLVPILTLAWTAESNQEDAFLGYSVGAAGDVNGDGNDDVVVSAYRYDDPQTDEGRVMLYQGTASGLDATEAWTATSDQDLAYFGYSSASAGDVDGDGYADVIVGAEYYDGGSKDEGRAYVYQGSATGLGVAPAWTAEPDKEDSWFGSSVSSAGDVNGDGYADVVVGAEAYANALELEGAAFVYHGSASGLSLTAAWSAESDQFWALFGDSVSTAGDVNGDGYDDVIVGAYRYDGGLTDEGRAYLYLGTVSGLEAAPAWTAESDQASALFGYSVSTAGDVNGDGIDDVVVGAVGYDNGEEGEGRAFVFLGNTTGLEPTASWTAETDQSGSQHGNSVGSAGDVDADGYDDIVVSANLYSNGELFEGGTFLYLGSPTGLAAAPAWTAESDQERGFLGSSVGTAGDVNDDGHGDVVVGAHLFDNGEDDEGRAFLFLGPGCDDDDPDADADTIADACDRCSGFDDLDDVDGDGAPSGCDVCPSDADPDQEDADTDGIGDTCDPCPMDALDTDADADGICAAEDCDDANASVYPGAPELCDGLDNACAGSIAPSELDQDGDGEFVCAGDCDDANPELFSGQTETCNGLDDNCDGALLPNELDVDHDRIPVCGGDCDDHDDRASPELNDLCGDDIDNNCDGAVDETCTAADGGGCRGCHGRGSTGGSSFLGLALALWAAAGRCSRTIRAAPRLSSSVLPDPTRSSDP